ncbi:MAG: putative toxin-antitoxin system toxin component, PIN family [Pseudomonadota bacterium]
MTKRKLTTVIDCNIIISAGMSDGNCRQVISNILKNHQNYICQEILLEYKEVINRKKFQNYKLRLLSLVKIICEHSILVKIDDIKNAPKLPDQDDEIYLKTAIKGDCDFLITGNLKDFPQSKYLQTQIISAKNFLNFS